jgi:hypothetical protein
MEAKEGARQMDLDTFSKDHEVCLVVAERVEAL